MLDTVTSAARTVTNTVQKVQEQPKPQPVQPQNTQPATTQNVASGSASEKNGLDSNLATGLIKKGFGIISNAVNSAVERRQEIERIAKENAPILVLPEGKYNLPTNPEDYIANSRLREDVSFWKDKELGNNTDGKTDNNFSPTDVGNMNNENAFLDLDNDARGTLGDKNAPIFYRFEEGKDGKPPTMTYHFFYPYNDAPSAHGVDFNHEGDWERVTYELDPDTLKPVNALLSAHEGGERIPFGELQKDSNTNRPFVFPANGSHANYAEPGTSSLPFGAKDYTVSDKNNDGIINENDGAVLFDTQRDLREVTSQNWYPNNDSKGIHWGEIGEIKYSTGPYGPSSQKGSVEIEEKESKSLLDRFKDSLIIANLSYGR